MRVHYILYIIYIYFINTYTYIYNTSASPSVILSILSPSLCLDSPPTKSRASPRRPRGPPPVCGVDKVGGWVVFLIVKS